MFQIEITLQETKDMKKEQWISLYRTVLMKMNYANVSAETIIGLKVL